MTAIYINASNVSFHNVVGDFVHSANCYYYYVVASFSQNNGAVLPFVRR